MQIRKYRSYHPSFTGLLWLSFLFLLPLVNLSLFLNPYYFPKVILLWTLGGLSTLVFSFRILTKKPVFLPPKPVLLTLLFFWTTYLLSTILSIHPLTSLVGVWGEFTQSLLHYTILILIFLSTYHIKTYNPKFIPWFLWTTMLSAFLVSLWGISEYLTTFPGQRITSTIGEPNRLALFLIAVVPFSFFLLNQSSKKTRFALIGINLVILLGILLTYSRGSWLILVAAGMSYGIFSFHSLRQKSPQLVFAPITIFLALILGVGIFLPRSVDRQRLDRTLYNLVHQQGSSHIRLLEWQAAMNTVLKRSVPGQHLLGTGPATITYTFLKERPLSFNQLPGEQYWRLTQVRNHYLNLLTNTGLLGLGSWLILVYQILAHLPRFSSKTKQNLPLLISWGIILFSGWYSFFPLVTQTLFWVLAALLVSSQKKTIPRINSLFTSCFLFLGGGFLFLALAFFTISIAAGERLARQRRLPEALQFFPWADFYHREAARIALDYPAGEENLNFAFNQALQAYQLNSLEPKNLSTLEKVLTQEPQVSFLTPHPSLAQVRLDWATKDPTSPQAHDRLGLTYLEAKNWSAAIAEFSFALTLSPDSPSIQRHLSEAFLLQKQE